MYLRQQIRKQAMKNVKKTIPIPKICQILKHLSMSFDQT